MLGIFHDDPKVTPEAELRSDAAVTVGPDVEGEGDIEIAAVPGGFYAVGVLEGPYEKLHEAYAWIHSTRLPTSGREVAGGARYEVYLNDARSVAPEEIRPRSTCPSAERRGEPWPRAARRRTSSGRRLRRSAPAGRPQLAKELRLLDVYALATGATLSAGLFLLPGIAAAQAGVAIPLCYLIAAIPLFPAVMRKVELATAMPKAGGTYYFLDRSPALAGTVGGVGTWLALILKTAFALVGLGAYLALYVEPTLAVMKSIAVGFALLGLLNILGAKKTATFQKVLVGVLLAILAGFAVFGVAEVDLGAFAGFFDAAPTR